jgi:Ni/Co efflux regulator RcnB
MKKFIIAALAASVLTTPVLAADRGHNNNGRYEQSHRQVTKRVVVQRNDRYGQNQYRNWQRGQRFESRYARNYRVISSPQQYRLHNPPRGYRWVQSGNDAVLIGITSGIIASVLSGAIR